MDGTIQNAPVFDKQGHRGCRGLMPENTIPAMMTALDLGVTTLELDIVFTRDKKAILSHEPFFSHEITTKPDGSYVTEEEEQSLNIYAMDYAEVKNFDVGLKPHPRFPRQKKIKVSKPLLTDLFDSVASYVKAKGMMLPFFNMETKSNPLTDDVYHPGPAEFVDRIMEIVKKYDLKEKVIIQSFDFRTLQHLHLHYPEIKTAMLIEDFDHRGVKAHLDALGFLPTIYSPHYSLVNEELIKFCHGQGIKVIPWTVNEKEMISELKKSGVDGIITDYPDLFE